MTEGEYDCRSVTVEPGEMLAFAQRYDLQPVQVDPRPPSSRSTPA